MSLSFKPILMEKVLVGEKTVTRRAWPTNYKAGQVVSIVPGMGRIACGKVRIVDVRSAMVGCSDEEARREGFGTGLAFERYWKELHGSFNPYERCARIEFELVETTRTICECCAGIGTLAATQPAEGGEDA